MAQKVEFDIEIKTNVDKIAKGVDKVNESFKETSDIVKDINKSTKKAEGGIKSFANGIKGIGLAIKAAGIGLLISAFNLLKETFAKNQGVVDKFNIAMEMLSTVMKDFISLITDGFPNIIKFFKDVFENPIESIKKFGELIKENLTERFRSFIDTLGFAAQALKELFKGNFQAAMDAAGKAGKEYVDVFTGVNNTVDKSIKVIEEAAKSTVKYGKKVYDAAKALINQRNAAQLAAAEQAKLVEIYDRQAEKLRQVRDNDLLSVKDRIKANDDLKKVLDNQEAAMKSQAALQVSAAALEVKASNTIENKVALINAQANQLGVLAQIEGLRSEQEANRIALLKESIDLEKIRTQGISDAFIAEEQAVADLLKNEQSRLNAQLNNLKQEKEIQLGRLKDNIELYAKDTAARQEAENEYNAKKQEINAAIRAKEDEIATSVYNREQQLRQDVINNEIEAFSTRLFALQKFNEEAQKSTQISEDEKVKIARETLVQQRAIENQRLAMVANTLGNISSLFEASSTAGKAFAIAQSLINTYQGITAELATKTATPFEFGLKVANIAATAAIGFKAVRDIINTQPSNSAEGIDTSGGAGVASAAPQFNVVGASGINQVAQTINKQANTPVKAYVVSKDVTTAQSLDRNIVNSASM
ncbi:hypothetical protein UFOVP324_15 [uncultured Caudovirales phage]|uniref:Uncharacterized protein n=1 Tax=uncultured Caudovirales phage TaxID=2100421 RepID=A0A6J5LRP4_9CAUD|nr:hypothetical protein UFOVP324_15 [uncultured Caudovirales phage]